MRELTAETFWQTDLKDIESSFLPEGVVITDLPLTPYRMNVKVKHKLTKSSKHKQLHHPVLG